MDNYNKYGNLLSKNNITLSRRYFKEMCKLLGINCLYRAPISSTKEFNFYGELDSCYQAPEIVPAIFEDHPDQKSLKKMGWVSELSESSSMIHVPYDLHDLQVGAIFIIPSGIDGAEGRVFRVISMKNIMVYPASITCEIAPVFEDTMSKTETQNFKLTDMNLLAEEDEYE